MGSEMCIRDSDKISCVSFCFFFIFTVHETGKGTHHTIIPYFCERNVKLEELSAVDLTLFYKYCKTRTYRGKPIKGNTIRHYHAVIHKALQDAVVVLHILQYNVADYVVAPKIDNYVAPYADTDELHELINDLMQSPIRVPVMFAAFYGMRRSEALGIRKAVIDRKKKTITVCHTIIEVNLMGEHKIIRKDRTKNKKSFRTYPLIPQIEMFLDWELQQQEKQRELMGSCYYMGDQEYICLDANGHLLRPDYVTSKFSELVKKRGLKKITFHGLRHSCASMLYEKGQDMKKIQEWLGHSTPVTTETIYAHLNVKHKDETAWIANDCLTLKLPESIKAGAF